jgi:hypothetical protein
LRVRSLRMAARKKSETQKSQPRVSERLPQELVTRRFEADTAGFAAASGDGRRRIEDDESFEWEERNPKDVEAAHADATRILSPVDFEVVAPTKKSATED